MEGKRQFWHLNKTNTWPFSRFMGSPHVCEKKTHMQFTSWTECYQFYIVLHLKVRRQKPGRKHLLLMKGEPKGPFTKRYFGAIQGSSPCTGQYSRVTVSISTCKLFRAGQRWRGYRVCPLSTCHDLSDSLRRGPPASIQSHPGISLGHGRRGLARSGVALLQDGGMQAGKQVGCPDLTRVWALVLNGSWVHGEWMRQRWQLTLRCLHQKSEDNVHWCFAGPPRG